VAAVAALLVLAGLFAGCSSSDDTAATTTTTTSKSTAKASTTTGAPKVLTILVSNDDGVKAPGIDAMVTALTKLADTKVVVSAPASDQSGSGGKTTPSGVTAGPSTTASGYPATSVTGFPADSVDWALDGGIPEHPQLVVSGINAGQNIGKLIDLSGTVGAARAASSKGVPALAVSAAFAPTIDYGPAAKLAVDWVQAHRADLLAGKMATTPAPVANLNVPNCSSGSVRGVVDATVDASAEISVAAVDCSTQQGPAPSTDVAALAAGYAPLSVVTATAPGG
jgi:5'-nucleotidase